MMARFLKCAVVTNWLLYTPVQIFFHLVLVHKAIWCSLSSLSIQTGVLAVTLRITLIELKNLIIGEIYTRKYWPPYNYDVAASKVINEHYATFILNIRRGIDKSINYESSPHVYLNSLIIL